MRTPKDQAAPAAATVEPEADRTGAPADEPAAVLENTTRQGRARQRPAALRGAVTTAWLADSSAVLFMVLMIVVFSFALPGTFPTAGNLRSVLGDQAVPGLLALAVVPPLMAGEFDLSVAANLGFCSVMSAKMASSGWSPVAIVIVCLLLGLAIGAANALLVVKVGVNAFIATLGMSTILAGGNLWVTNGNTIYQGISQSFTSISTTHVLGVQIVFVYFVVFVFVLWYLIERTPYGRYLRATGLGRESARLSGVRTSRFLFSSFLLAGVIAGACGVLNTAQFGSATATVGPDFLLPAYAAAFLGATTIKRGMFNVWGTVVGLFLLAIGINGLTLAGVPFWVPSVFNGGALIVAVSASVIVSRRRGRRKV